MSRFSSAICSAVSRVLVAMRFLMASAWGSLTSSASCSRVGSSSGALLSFTMPPSAFHVELIAAIRVNVSPDERREYPPIDGSQALAPVGLRQDPDDGLGHVGPSARAWRAAGIA